MYNQSTKLKKVQQKEEYMTNNNNTIKLQNEKNAEDFNNGLWTHY